MERLLATLQELERELAEVDSLDPAARSRLKSVAQEIHLALGERNSQTLTEPSLNERLRDAARDFESSHPTLAGLLERVVDALAQLGI